MASDTSPIAEQGVATLPDEAWAQARHRAEIIGPLAALEVVGHEAADAAAQALGLSRRQAYVLIRRVRQGTGLVTDLARSRSGGGKGKGRLPESVERIIRETNPSADVVVASNPEFLREGAAIRDFKWPDRIVVGTADERGRKVLGDIYRPLSLNQAPIMYTARRTAELIKYAANAFLATKITFINEVADLAEKVGADVQEVARGIGLDNRIGAKFLHAGPGFGGSCFPKDTRALIKIAQDNDTQLRIVESVLAVNDNRKRAMARKVAHAVGGNLRGKTIAVLGLTFKPETDDMREAPSIPLVTGLLDMGAKVRAHDPVGIEQAKKELPEIAYYDDPYDCATGADAIVLVTEWVQYRAMDLDRLKEVMAHPVVVDLRNVYRPDEMAAHGFIYESVGRPSAKGA